MVTLEECLLRGRILLQRGMMNFSIDVGTLLLTRGVSGLTTPRFNNETKRLHSFKQKLIYHTSSTTLKVYRVCFLDARQAFFLPLQSKLHFFCIVIKMVANLDITKPLLHCEIIFCFITKLGSQICSIDQVGVSRSFTQPIGRHCLYCANSHEKLTKS